MATGVLKAPKLAGHCSPVELQFHSAPVQRQTNVLERLPVRNTPDDAAKAQSNQPEGLAAVATPTNALSVEELGWPTGFDAKYDLGEELGHGSFGTVHAAVDKVTGARYAVKIIPKSRGASRVGRQHAFRSQQLTKIKQEAHFLSMFSDSPYSVKLIDLFEDETSAYIVQELCSGSNLKDILDSCGPFSEDRAAQIVQSILGMIAVCHARNVHYGDVKLANFMLADGCADKPTVKAIDFGCSSKCPEGVYMKKVMGTPLYCAPEQYQHRFDKQADMWGIGVMMYQLLSGLVPFWDSLDGLTMLALMEGTLTADIDWSADVWRGVSADAKDLICKLLDREPSRRLTAAQALQHPWFARAAAAAGAADARTHVVSNIVPFRKHAVPVMAQ